MQSISLAAASVPFVLAIDIGTSSTRVLLFDAAARQIAETETQATWDLIATPDGGLEADARALAALVCHTIDTTLGKIERRKSEIAAVGVSCFWHSLLGLDGNYEPTTPLLMWIDSRSRQQAHALREDAPLAEAMRAATGCRPHASYWPAKLAWLARTAPETGGRTRHWVAFSDYLMSLLTNELVGSVCMASGSGLLDLATHDWHGDLARRFGVAPDRLPPLRDRHEALSPLNAAFGARWPALARVPWFPALGDGAAANIGSGCVGADRIAMTIGTSAAMRVIVPTIVDVTSPQQLWEYRVDRAHRIVGGALSNGGNVSRWIADLVSEGDLAALAEQSARDWAPDDHGLTWLPFFAGERSPSWNDDAFATLLGMRFTTTREQMYRAALEGTAYRLAAVYDDLKAVADPAHDIHANGGAALNSPQWMQIIADTFGQPLRAMDADAEVSARGAAISALEAIGAWPSLREPDLVATQVFAPDQGRHHMYRAARQRQARYEAAIFRTQAEIGAVHS